MGILYSISTVSPRFIPIVRSKNPFGLREPMAFSEIAAPPLSSRISIRDQLSNLGLLCLYRPLVGSDGGTDSGDLSEVPTHLLASRCILLRTLCFFLVRPQCSRTEGATDGLIASVIHNKCCILLSEQTNFCPL